MTTEKQLEANRANALKSTGPRTEAGKNRSSLNALRHGLTGHVVVLPNEDQEILRQFTAKIIADLDVQGDHELQLATTYATAMWNVQRAMAIQENLFTLGLMEEVAENLNIEHPEIHNAISCAKTFRQDSEVFSRVSLYAQRLVNQSKTLLKQLQEVQVQRRQRHQAEMTEAVRAYRYKQMVGEIFDPAQNGFVFSLDQIRRASRRQTLDSNS
ncbi:MAG TPA: hypothetical protein VGL72_03225, partial [Bryobacteraceae bacterium]